MGHHHHHLHDTGNIKVAFFLNLGFTIIEIIGGFWTNSLAILSDALHDLGDSLSLGISWYFQKIASKGRDDTFSYGYRRFSILGAIINSIVLIVGSIFILIEAIPQLLDPSETNARGMMYLAILGIIVNGAAVMRLKKGKSLNEKVISLHLLEDVLGWFAVLIGSIIMIFYDVPVIDPFLSILISLYILFNVYKNLKHSLTIVLQGAPKGIDADELHKILTSVKVIEDVHDCHIWSLDGQYNVLTIHLVLDNNYDLERQAEIKKEIKSLLRKSASIEHITIEFESSKEQCEHADC